MTTTNKTNNMLISTSELLDMYKLKTIIRYNQRQKLKDETVAEHSFFVAIITLKLCNKFKLNEQMTCKAITKALLHDMPEIELNDITYPVKEALNLRPLLKQFEDNYYLDKFPNQAKLMQDDSNNVVNAIVNYADALSVLQYALNEESLGNTNFQSIKNNAISRLEGLAIILMEVLYD